VAGLILLEAANVDQQTVLFRNLVKQVMDVKETQLEVTPVVKILKFPPASSKVLILAQSIDLLHLLFKIKDELCDDEAGWTLLHHDCGMSRHSLDIYQSCYVVDQLEDAVKIKLQELRL